MAGAAAAGLEAAGAAAVGLEAALVHPEVLEVKLMVGSEGSAVVEVEAGDEGVEVSDVVVAAGSGEAWRGASEVEVVEGSAAGSEITALAGARASALTMVRWRRGRRRAHRSPSPTSWRAPSSGPGDRESGMELEIKAIRYTI